MCASARLLGTRQSNRPMETTMTIAIATAQGHGSGGRNKTCARASTPTKGRPGESRRMVAGPGAPSGTAQRDPGGAWAHPRGQTQLHARVDKLASEGRTLVSL